MHPAISPTLSEMRISLGNPRIPQVHSTHILPTGVHADISKEIDALKNTLAPEAASKSFR